MEVVRKTLKDLKEIEEIEKKISEFKIAYNKEQYLSRLRDKKHYSIFFAVEDKKTVGYAVSYGLDDKFYIWTLAVLKEYRRKGTAEKLLQESIGAGKKFRYKKAYLKTRNIYKNMMLLALKSGFKIVRVTKKADVDQNRIWMEKGI
ncbi:MAG: GNAT family N-acetyltransferase [Nanoarchaeota archaeon]|nr:GNAT family N-acetyltransferase [Nanoarchaeota archaeon]